ncbi:CDP-glucose 4,6-dehydratase [Helicobacter sp. MIT 14-3879]|uniref:CDP-glucose 4,6-dehydratase n=1 Tax=Helicobacter sp. MIT 14-3879 TaxID=2040649 RepID=UPI000E1E76FD|nr:CDP-glucose 4,6-dehydratase [Helicobacter sp. MIT 14-3879]RDU61719.1 CDP-glucose 4,6-dehydratase [Helicobacter sp. MIT 14-3879]
MQKLNIYRNKRVFLTGHTGFKGSWLNLMLQNFGAEVFGYSLPPKDKLNHFDLLNMNNGVFKDILDIKSLSKALLDFNPHIIFHLAAQPLVRESYKDPINTFQTNAIGTLNILEVARKLKELSAIVVITTDKVYENKEWIWGYRENDTIGGGCDPYSSSKACAEIITNSMQQSFFNLKNFNKTHRVLIATARAGNVIGGGDFSDDRLIPDLMRGIQRNEATLIRHPNSTRPWQNVLEPLRGYMMLGEKLMEGKSEFATSFNFGPSMEGNLSVKCILEETKKLWNKINYKIQIPNADKSLYEANLLMLDSTKANNILKWKPIYDSFYSIKTTIQWYKAFYESNEILSHSQLKNYINESKMNA